MEVRINCPFRLHGNPPHPDRKRKLSVNPGRNKAHCFRCGFSTRHAREALERVGVRLDVNWTATTPDDTPPCQLPESFRTDWSSSALGRQAFRYLTARGIAENTVYAYGIGFCTTGIAKQRVVVPVYDGETLATWRARDWTNTHPIKYTSPKGSHLHTLFNLERAAATGVVVIVEGVLDALRLPEYAAALCGKSLSRFQQAALFRAQPHHAYLWLDGEAEREAATVGRQLAGVVPAITVVRTPRGADPGNASAEVLARVADRCRHAARHPHP